MVRVLVRQALRLMLGLFGAVLAAAMISALSVERAGETPARFGAALGTRLVAMARFDFGISPVSGWSAFGELAHALPYTISLATSGAVLALLIGAPLGLLLGGSPLRRASAPLVQVVAAAPVFCAALALSWIAVRFLGIHPAPPGTTASISGYLLNTLLLPVLTVGLAGSAAVQVALRRSASAARGQPWRNSLRLMGLTTFEVDRLYVGPEVAAGFLAQLGDVVLALFAASTVAEWMFGWPGAAALFVKSLAYDDWNVTALVLLVFVAIKLGADFLGALASRAITGEAA